ncbi:MAG: hypothetical protein AAFN70_21395, partial [Planctomycetota bacterium]
MSLERKCLLAFGVSLLLMMCLAFYVVMAIADGLVLDGTSQRTHDYSAIVFLREHSDSMYAAQLNNPETAKDIRERLNQLQSEIVADDFKYQVLGLADEPKFDNLPEPQMPVTDKETEILQELRTRYRSRLQTQIEKKPPAIDREFDLEENQAMRQVGPAIRPLSRALKTSDGKYVNYIPFFFKSGCLVCHSQTGASVPSLSLRRGSIVSD